MHSRGEDGRIPGVTSSVEQVRLVLRILGADEHPNASVKLWMKKVTFLIKKLLGKQAFGPEQTRRFEEDVGAVLDDELVRESIWVVNFDVTANGVSPIVTVEFGQKGVNAATLHNLGTRLVGRHPELVEQDWWRNMVQALCNDRTCFQSYPSSADKPYKCSLNEEHCEIEHTPPLVSIGLSHIKLRWDPRGAAGGEMTEVKVYSLIGGEPDELEEEEIEEEEIEEEEE